VEGGADDESLVVSDPTPVSRGTPQFEAALASKAYTVPQRRNHKEALEQK
jgi:hypothetical protein